MSKRIGFGNLRSETMSSIHSHHTSVSSYVSDESDPPLFDHNGEVIGRTELQLDWSDSEEIPLTSPTDPGDRVADFKNQKVVNNIEI